MVVCLYILDADVAKDLAAAGGDHLGRSDQPVADRALEVIDQLLLTLGPNVQEGLIKDHVMDPHLILPLLFKLVKYSVQLIGVNIKTALQKLLFIFLDFLYCILFGNLFGLE